MRDPGYRPTCDDCRARLSYDDVMRGDDLCAKCFDLRAHKAERRRHGDLGPRPGMTKEARDLYEEADARDIGRALAEVAAANRKMNDS